MSGRDLLPSLQSAMNAAALKRAGRRRKRVVFLIHSPETFSTIEPVIEELQRRADVFDLLFFALPRSYTGGGTRYSGMDSTYLFLHQKGLNPVALAGRSMSDLETLVRLAPDFIFRQSPWELDIPPVFNSALLGFAHLCYIPYGMMVGDHPAAGYNQPFHNACDFIFCETEFHQSAFMDHREMGGIGLHLTGYPRTEHFLRELESLQDAPWPIDCPEDTPRVIWAPHHSVSTSWLGFSTFLMHKDTMLEEARRGRLSILFRPHPALKERLCEGHQIMSSADYDDYVRAFAAAGCSGVDTRREYIGSFAASDCLLTDGVSFFADYLLTGKPLLRTRREGSLPLNAFGEWLVEGCDNVDDGEQLQQVLDALAERRYVDPKLALRTERAERLAALAEGASRRVVDTLQAW